MMWAINDNKKIEAQPKTEATCPLCGADVLSKCGDIKVWHWSHKNKKDCDSWWEPESEWHKLWKNYYPIEQQEFSMGIHRADIRTSGRWIIELQNSTISSKNIKEREEYYKRMIWLINGGTLAKGIRIRNKKGTITFRWKNPPKSWWIAEKDIYVDMSEIVDSMKRLIVDYEDTDKKYYSKVSGDGVYYEYYDEYGEHREVSYPTTYKVDTTEEEIKKLKMKAKLIDGKIFLIKKIYKKIPCGGWGILISKDEFLNRFK